MEMIFEVSRGTIIFFFQIYSVNLKQQIYLIQRIFHLKKNINAAV